MLGKYVRVKVTIPIFSKDPATDLTYELNFGEINYVTSRKRETLHAFVMGIRHPVDTFDGRVIASFEKGHETYYVVAPRNKKYIINDVRKALDFFEPKNIRCYFEISCGAIVFRKIKDQYRFLVIKNNRSAHWSFPKGHVEPGETYEQTAKREVLEETGVHIRIIPGFRETSDYMIQNRISKSVILFAASTKDTRTIIQESEIEDYAWLSYEQCMQRMRFDNDKTILTKMRSFLLEKGLIEE